MVYVLRHCLCQYGGAVCPSSCDRFPLRLPQVLLSGGVDSTVCTALLNKALNQEQVIAVHIDNGFMRKRESQSVEEALTKLGIKLKGARTLSWRPSVLVFCHNMSIYVKFLSNSS